MEWDDYYSRFDGWGEWKRHYMLHRLSSYGPPEQIVEIAQGLTDADDAAISSTKPSPALSSSAPRKSARWPAIATKMP